MVRSRYYYIYEVFESFSYKLLIYVLVSGEIRFCLTLVYLRYGKQILFYE